MKRQLWNLLLIGGLILLLFCGQVNNLIYAQNQKILLNWEFDEENNLQGWTTNHLTLPKVSNGTFKSQFTDHDPFIVSPQFEFEPKAGQVVEIRMKLKSDWRGELFFSGTNEGQYNGFSQDRSFDWTLINDGQWHEYRLFPNWMKEGKIIKIRLDLGTPSDSLTGQTGVEIDSIRIVDLNLEAVAPISPEWNADQIQKEWTTVSEKDSVVYRSGLFSFDAEQSGSWLFLEWNDLELQPSMPKWSQRIKENPDFAFATIRFLGEFSNGLTEKKVPIQIFDAQCNIDLSQLPEWKGKIYQLEIVLPDLKEESPLNLKTVKVSDKPQGKAQWEVVSSGMVDAINRAGSEVQYEIVLKNVGGEMIENKKIFLLLTPWKKTENETLTTNTNSLIAYAINGKRKEWNSNLSEDNSENVNFFPQSEGKVPKEDRVILIPGLQPMESLKLTVYLNCPTAGNWRIVIYDVPTIVATPNEIERSLFLRSDAVFKITEPLDLPKADYVPEPKPIQSDYEIGALYFPGWAKREAWDRIQKSDPIRKPVLGWYDESNPEVVDWQIKWAVENGIQFFLVDWYWSRGNRSLEHWIKAFQRAKYRSHLKWAMMWANHNGPGTHSEEDQRNVTKYWIENYFNTPEYYRVDDKPVVMIWDPKQMDLDLIKTEAEKGNHLNRGEGVKKLLDLSRQMAIDAGFKGIYFVAMKWPESSTKAEDIQWLKDGGFDCSSIYHFMSHGGKAKNPIRFPFDLVVESSLPYWQARTETGILPFWPNISTGWDSRPWHGNKQTIIYDRTVEKFRKICEDCKRFADETGQKRIVLAPVNEWGEGSYIEPNAEFGFGMYEAIRETFGQKPQDGFPLNFGPTDVGLGPYDLPPTD
ncbi:MAG: glycoside hydrolase family 99-like domain-containing protein [Planctomycetia bacterium]|nr:glycoside hydrolase family 99-like domain-containing protein [Planctomycetia bacterium]